MMLPLLMMTMDMIARRMSENTVCNVWYVAL